MHLSIASANNGVRTRRADPMNVSVVRGMSSPHDPMHAMARLPSIGKKLTRNSCSGGCSPLSGVGMITRCRHHHDSGGSAGSSYQREV